MGKTSYKKAKEMVEGFVKGDSLGFVYLQGLIKMNIGGDPRTVENVIRLMLDTKLIKDIGNSHFKVL